MTARGALVVAVALAGCGDNVKRDGLADASAGCTATFGGNFAETSSSDACASVAVDGAGDATLALTIPTTTLPPSLKVTIDLGASPSPGSYSSDTVTSWSARGVQDVGNGVCLYSAGTTAVPTGSFALQLTGVAAGGELHGTLMLTIYVLAFPGTDCGSGDIETVSIAF